MPHLSPMNWLITICLLWLFLLVLSSSLFFQHPSSFMPPKIYSKAITSSSWVWLLQDGRD